MRCSTLALIEMPGDDKDDGRWGETIVVIPRKSLSGAALRDPSIEVGEDRIEKSPDENEDVLL
jgi:hypothetical protein